MTSLYLELLRHARLCCASVLNSLPNYAALQYMPTQDKTCMTLQQIATQAFQFSYYCTVLLCTKPCGADIALMRLRWRGVVLQSTIYLCTEYIEYLLVCFSISISMSSDMCQFAACACSASYGTNTNTHTHTYIYIYMYVYLQASYECYINTYICTCICCT